MAADAEVRLCQDEVKRFNAETDAVEDVAIREGLNKRARLDEEALILRADRLYAETVLSYSADAELEDKVEELTVAKAELERRLQVEQAEARFLTSELVSMRQERDSACVNELEARQRETKCSQAQAEDHAKIQALTTEMAKCQAEAWHIKEQFCLVMLQKQVLIRDIQSKADVIYAQQQDSDCCTKSAWLIMMLLFCI